MVMDRPVHHHHRTTTTTTTERTTFTQCIALILRKTAVAQQHALAAARTYFMSNVGTECVVRDNDYAPGGYLYDDRVAALAKRHPDALAPHDDTPIPGLIRATHTASHTAHITTAKHLHDAANALAETHYGHTTMRSYLLALVGVSTST